MQPQPLVSILINNYNYGRFLTHAIESALAQTYKRIEIIVVDDGSTDGSQRVISSYSDKIIAICKENGGQASAFNAGFEASKGEIVCLLDSDDLYLPGKVEHVVEVFRANPQIGWCFDRVHEFSDLTGEQFQPPEALAYGLWDVRGEAVAGRPPLVPTATSGLSFSKRTLRQILPMPEILKIADAYLKFIAMGVDPGWFSRERLTLQRIHGNNAYTKRIVGRRRLNGQLNLLTGLSLYQHHPILRRLAVKLFSCGLGTLWAQGGVGIEVNEIASSFLTALAPKLKCEVLLRAAYWNTTIRLSSFGLNARDAR
jgi:glycosyltransferase involved in cell wall biosynthesis